MTAPWVASQQSSQRKPRSAPRAVALIRLDRVERTGRRESALATEDWTKKDLVTTHAGDHESRGGSGGWLWSSAGRATFSVVCPDAVLVGRTLPTTSAAAAALVA